MSEYQLTFIISRISKHTVPNTITRGFPLVRSPLVRFYSDIGIKLVLVEFSLCTTQLVQILHKGK